MLLRFFISCVIIGIISIGSRVHASEILFESRQVTEIARGVQYVDSRMMTPNGMLDVHALIVDITSPHVTVGPVYTRENLGRKDTALNMLRNAGAVAGINADFFGMAGDYSTHFGIMARDGRLIAANPSINTPESGQRFASFLLDRGGTAFFRYVRADVQLLINGAPGFRIASYNTVGQQLWGPVILDRHTVTDNRMFFERFGSIATLVVENNVLRRIALDGEIATVPQNGFLVIMPTSFMNQNAHMMQIGSQMSMRLSTDLRIDFSRIEAAIGGGAVIMQGGQAIENVIGTFPAGRNPRSAIGQTADRRLVLLVVDGRGHSIGANREELVSILKQFGVVNAVALDGGGSTTLVTSRRGQGYTVQNTPSDGSQRSIINALGVFSRAGQGPPVALGVYPASDYAVVGVPLEFEVVFLDQQDGIVRYNPMGDFSFSSDPTAGFMHDGRYVPTRPGAHSLNVAYGTLGGTMNIQALELGELRPGIRQMVLQDGESVSLRYTGITVCGREVPLTFIADLSVTPPDLGFFDGMEFTAAGTGLGYITAQVGSVVSHFAVAVGMPSGVVDLPPSTVGTDRLRAVTGFAGFQGGESLEFLIPERGSNPGYSLRRWSSFAILTLPIINRSIPAEYWGVFVNDLRESGAANVVVMLSISHDEFYRRMEFELLHRVLSELTEGGMRIFVVSPAFGQTDSIVRDDVRYINHTESIVRFWTSGDGIVWD